MGQERDGSGAVTIVRVAEAEIGRDVGQQIQALLQLCFPGFPGRTYFKLPPHFRDLAIRTFGRRAGLLQLRRLEPDRGLMPGFRTPGQVTAPDIRGVGPVVRASERSSLPAWATHSRWRK